MEDLTPEQIIQIGQMYFPQLDGQQIMDIFEQYKEALPKGTSNLDIVKVIKMQMDNRKGQAGKPKLDNLRELMSKR